MSVVKWGGQAYKHHRSNDGPDEWYVHGRVTINPHCEKGSAHHRYAGGGCFDAGVTHRRATDERRSGNDRRTPCPVSVGAG